MRLVFNRKEKSKAELEKGNEENKEEVQKGERKNMILIRGKKTNKIMIQDQRCATLGVPATVAATVAAAATRCPTVDLDTQLAVAPLVAPLVALVQAAVCQALVREDVRPVVKDLALPPSTSTITTWKTTTGPSLTSVCRTFYPSKISRSLSESYKARAAHARAHMC